MRCRYCAEPAGFSKIQHLACRERHRDARPQAALLVQRGACEGRNFGEVGDRVRDVLGAGWVSGESAFEEVLAEGLEAAERKVLDDDLLDEEEERSVLGFIESLDPVHAASPRVDQVRQRLEQAGILRLVMEGRNPFSRQTGMSLHGIRFMKSEQPVWRFEGVDYQTMKKRVTYSGGSRGMSVRVARGVYARTGSIRARRHVEEHHEHTDAGRLIVTTKHVYFVGSKHRFRVRHDRVVSYQPFQNGFELTRDRANARPEQFVGMDGWFVYNLLMNAEELR